MIEKKGRPAKIEHRHEHDDYTFKDTEKESGYGMSTEHTLSYDAFLYYPLSVELRQSDGKEEQIYLSFEQAERFTKWFLRNYVKLEKEHKSAVKMMDGESADDD